MPISDGIFIKKIKNPSQNGLKQSEKKAINRHFYHINDKKIAQKTFLK